MNHAEFILLTLKVLSAAMLSVLLNTDDTNKMENVGNRS